MLAFSNDYYGMIFRATQSVELFCAYELTPDCSLHPDCFMYFSFKNNGYSFEDMIRILIENTEEYYIKECK